jgi:predicted helicase
MPNSNRFGAFGNFNELLAYLDEELGWPLQGYQFDDLTFSYEPQELGLRDEDAAKIKRIHQLRPLETGQPWGIFFVEFDRKKLPVVVLRRVLSHLVIRKRASANKAERAAWLTEDLLFVSAFGEESTAQREIAFAHFHQDQGDLPTLRVLGWDGADTPLKLAHVAATLKERLRWPANPSDHAAWRQQWSRAFRHRVGHVIRTADALAEVLAALARKIRDAAHTIIRHESDKGPLTKLYKAFQASLIHDLTEETFVDTYAQTITYGLLTAAISRTDRSGETGTALIADNITDMVPVTNPFLKEMLQTFLRVGGRKGGIDFDELGIQDVVELLRDREKTDLDAVLRDFGNKTHGEDPVIHFYEGFAKRYDPIDKAKRGEFYTPTPVVSYIVRSVHELLQTEFGLADGLADTITWGEMLKKHPALKLPPLTDEPGEKRTISPDEPFVQILDPATGTATFLVEVIDVIHRHLEAKWKKGGAAAMPRQSSFIPHPSCFAAFWNDYVPKALLPRLHAFELKMAPYAIAHMKIGLKLAETGYCFGTEERARIYLTNALEPKVKQLPQIGFDALAHEAAAVNEIKWYKRFTVVIGNPPYAGYSANPSKDESGTPTHIGGLIQRYFTFRGQPLGEKQPKWLHDDYVKFFRLAETTITSSGAGVLGLITSHGFIFNPTFRGMRESILESFTRLAVLDLHGSSKLKERAPDGGIDRNVFDIEPGVAITLGVAAKHSTAAIRHASLFGTRELKYAELMRTSITTTSFEPIVPSGPFILFRPQQEDLAAEWSGWPRIVEAMPLNAVGIVTGRDAFAIDEDRKALADRIRTFCDPKLTDAEVRAKFGIRDAGGYVLAKRRPVVKGTDAAEHLRRVHYRPFDHRWVAYSRGFLTADQRGVMKHLLAETNIALLVGRAGQVIASGEWNLVFVSREPTEFNLYRRGGNNVFPLALNEDEGDLDLSAGGRPNFSPGFLKAIASLLELQLGVGGLPTGLTPGDIFHYAYSVFHSPGYRSRYAEFLKIDFPRLPLTGNLELFRALARLGGELTALHLLESPKLDQPITNLIGSRDPEVEKVSWARDTVWVDKSQTTGFQGVHEDVWDFHIGGYQVCEKWLKDRKGRTLTKDDLTHYQKIVVALSETIRLMVEIDEVIEEHGGWPLK